MAPKPDHEPKSSRRRFILGAGAVATALGTGSAAAHVSDNDWDGANETGNETWNETGNETNETGNETDITPEDAPVAAVQQGWGEPVEGMSSDFDQGDLEGEWSQWGSGPDNEGCYEVDTWNGQRCGKNSDVIEDVHRIEGSVDGETSGSTSTNTFTWARIEWRERAYCVDHEWNETYNVTPLIYPANPDNQKAGNGEIDVAERRVGETPFFCVHWMGDNYYINVSDLDGTKWHNYAVEWLPDSITWYIDGIEVDSFDISIDMEATFNAGQMDMTVADGTPMQHTYYEIDWVKFYEHDASGPSPVPENGHEGGTDWTPTDVRSGIGWQGD